MACRLQQLTSRGLSDVWGRAIRGIPPSCSNSQAERAYAVSPGKGFVSGGLKRRLRRALIKPIAADRLLIVQEGKEKRDLMPAESGEN